MKSYKFIYLIALVFCIGCNDSFLDRYPESSLETGNFFKTASDLELFVNKLYLSESPKFMDAETDNASSTSNTTELIDLLHNNISAANVKGWNWGQVRELNYFLENATNATGNTELINHYIGIVRMLRAQEFYGFIKRYHEVPWYSKPLKDTDTELLFKKRDSRDLVMDSIFADLDFAVKNVLPIMNNRTTYNKWYAYGIKARIALHEGTYRKHHEELSMQESAAIYLQRAVESSDSIMKYGGFSIFKQGGVNAYENLFISEDLSECPEIILYKDYSINEKTLLKHDVAMTAFNYTGDLSRSLMESYLVKKNNRAVPFSSVPNYERMGFVETFVDRDPRYSQTFMYPGYIRPGEKNPYIPNMSLGGYPQIKFVTKDPVQMAWGNSYNDIPMMRYAEILLIYAEAKAELGTLTQMDVDKSINLLRDRVNMPFLDINAIAPDPVLEEIYPNVTDNKLVVLEVRRERRIELACEGFRKDDLMRWKCGKQFEGQQGIYVSGFGVFDVTGDGVADVGIYRNKKTASPIHLKKRLYFLEDEAGNPTNLSLSEGTKGYIVFTNDKLNPRKFIEPQYYYFPLPQDQLQLNPALGQTIFW